MFQKVAPFHVQIHSLLRLVVASTFNYRVLSLSTSLRKKLSELPPNERIARRLLKILHPLHFPE